MLEFVELKYCYNCKIKVNYCIWVIKLNQNIQL